VEALSGLLGPASAAVDWAQPLPGTLMEENLQARLRGVLVMALSNRFGHMVVTTGNKSEMATGYATLYGDMCGGFALIKDVPKTAGLRIGALAQPAGRGDSAHDDFAAALGGTEARPARFGFAAAL
jgi:NH3-dependent NAD+ synthetase